MSYPIRMIAHTLRAGLLALMTVATAHAAAPQVSVSTYHGHSGRSGNFVIPDLTWARARSLRRDRAFAPQISGHVYAQPLYWQPPGSASGVLFIVTESDTVYAIDAATGNTLWQRSVGAPVPLAALPCGNIDPLGITGTPIIDPATEAIYFDAVSSSGSPRAEPRGAGATMG